MKILYGVQGTGNGHITRARVMAKALRKFDVDVDWVFSGRTQNNYFDMEEFGNYQTYRGLTFVIENGRINFAKTAWQLHFRRLFHDIKHIDLNAYDVVINDFEPVTAWAAKQQKKHSIGLSHQSAFHYDIPKRNNSIFTDGVMKWFAPLNTPIGIHWHHFDSPILPPLIETKTITGTDPKHILVYFPFESLDVLKSLFRPFEAFNFYIYHDVPEAYDEEHIHVRPFSREGFHRDLQKTTGIISGASFELPSEAMKMGKKILVQPIAGQMEQASNAAALRMLKLATVCQTINRESLEEWLRQPNPRPIAFPNVAETFVEWLTKGEWNTYQRLVDNLWLEFLNQNTDESRTEVVPTISKVTF